ncbi:hypothetical protein FIV41_18045 [Pseudomonas marginalis]|uniref:Uncharacterized protein n=1 Tax=Pseudomonas marginalis TaxID=298 RepID=A0A9X9FWV2_PSEMA|nr:hypothetical protein [Pseudomonas marginalis]TWR58127.1 hypothetical protein FIV41_18045 [Pseudomonas marginalis]SEC92086.1 hypothetical protein SAMN04490193_4026 [Pseudomonas marginalis]
MSRGMFASIAASDAYKNADKEWCVELQTYHKYWYDLVVNPNDVADYFDTRKLIVEYLRAVKKHVEESLEKRFIYFICSREKVRFDTNKKPSFNPITKKTKIYIRVGKYQKKRSIHCKFYDVHSEKFCMPEISLSEKYITIADSEGDLVTSSIHDFLEEANIALGLDSKVEYVGYTKNPHTRPTNGAHTGLSDALYKVADENRDSLIYFNLFKVITRAVNGGAMLNFAMANAMTDEVDVDLEGELLEKCFIFYFDSVSQNRNKEKELLELKGHLSRVSSEHKISTIDVVYEFERPSEYGLFSSSKVLPKHRHAFTIRQVGGDVEIAREPSRFEKLV